MTLLNYVMDKGEGVEGERDLEPHCLSHFYATEQLNGTPREQ